jgi:hypothetical protein
VLSRFVLILRFFICIPWLNSVPTSEEVPLAVQMLTMVLWFATCSAAGYQRSKVMRNQYDHTASQQSETKCTIGAGVLSQYRMTTDWTAGVQSPAQANDFSSSLCVQTSSEAYPAFYSPVLPKGGKARPGRDADHSSPSSAEVKNEQKSYLLSPLVCAWRNGVALL